MQRDKIVERRQNRASAPLLAGLFKPQNGGDSYAAEEY